MIRQVPSAGTVTSSVLAFATCAFTIGIFIADLVTEQAIAVPVLYATVVLMAARFFEPRGVLLVSVGCAGLTALSFYLAPSEDSELIGVSNTLISISAIGLTTILVRQSQSAEVSLREQANLLDLTHDTVFARGMDDAIAYWNRAAEEQYGWTKAEAFGKVTHQLLETTFPAPLGEVNAELLRRGRWEGELVHKTRDGTRIVVASRWSLERDSQGRPAAILETNNDITERKQTQERLQQAQLDLARVNRVMLVGEMTASIAHEVNQPIAGAITNASAGLRWLAAQPPDMEEARQALGRIIRDGKRAEAVIGRIRALVKRVPTHRVRLDINETILDVIALARSELQRNPVEQRSNLASNLPLVSADRVQLQQVILNLIVNALDAMSEVSGRARELVLVSGVSDPGGVFVEVRDTGPGLDPANLPRLFDSFYTTKAEGIGMGLSISRSIVEGHGGRLTAEQNQPHGAVFRFTLPVDGDGSS